MQASEIFWNVSPGTIPPYSMLLPLRPQRSPPADFHQLALADESKFYIDEARHHVSVLVWLPALSVIILRCLHTAWYLTALDFHSCSNGVLQLNGLKQ